MMSLKSFIQISALSFGVTIPSYLHAVMITCDMNEYEISLSHNELVMLQNQLAEFLSAADVMNLNNDTIKNAMTCYLFGKINLDQLSFLSRERFKSSVKQSARPAEYDRSQEKNHFFNMLEFCPLNDNELNNLLTSTMDPKKQEAITEELKRRQKLIGQTGKKRPDIRCAKFTKLAELLSKYNDKRIPEKEFINDDEMRKIYKAYLTHTQPLAAQTKAKEDKGKEKEKERETDISMSDSDIDWGKVASQALEKREAMRTPKKGIQSQRQSTTIELKPLKYIIDEKHNLITSDQFTPTDKYLTAQDVAALFLDPEKPPQVAPWLKDRLRLTGEVQVQSIEKLAPVRQMSSENYRLILLDKSSNSTMHYFIKVEASPLRFGVQARADHLVKSLGFPKDEDDPIFVTQLTSVMVEFGGNIKNEIMVFPEIRATAPNQNNPLHWEAIGKALARLKIASMQHYDTYDS
ncbi:MAG TPA: hypothetical protein VNJ29_01020, partial [Candidatus Nitrosotenuis sp.]|nr:hypothetical protein [Candidatus Nitrosotenuis sp.]